MLLPGFTISFVPFLKSIKVWRNRAIVKYKLNNNYIIFFILSLYSKKEVNK